MSAPLSPEQRAAIVAQLGDAKPATVELIVDIAQQVKGRREHDHSGSADWDWFCLNLSGWLGDRMPGVLRRLLDAEARVAELERKLATDREVFLAEFENDDPRLFTTLDAAKDALTERRRHDDPLMPWDWFPDGDGLWVQWRCAPDTDRPVALLLGSVLPLTIPGGAE